MTVIKFSLEERSYLLSLDAVEDVSENTIRYSDSFKAECMRRYRAGTRPARIFRDAGLLPEILGYKRIERSVARWRQAEEKGYVWPDRSPVPRANKRKRLLDEIAELERLIQAKERELHRFDDYAEGDDEDEGDSVLLEKAG